MKIKDLPKSDTEKLIDGCEDYVRIGGNEGDYVVIKK